MRTTFIVATLVLSTLAVPVPQSQLEQGTEIHGCFRSNSPRDGEVNTRSPEQKLRACRITHPRDVDGNDELILDTRSPTPEPIGRGSHPRDLEDTENVEARAIRNEGLSHGAKPKGSNGKREPIYRASGRRDAEFDLVVRSVKNQRDAAAEPVIRPVKNQKRADEDGDDVEARAIRNEGKRSVREKTVSDDDDIEARAIRNEGKRSVREKAVADDDIEARGSNGNYGKKRSDDDIEARGAIRNQGSKRFAEPTVRPGNNGAICRPGHVTSKCGFNKRTTHNDQDIEDTEVRGSNKRDAEAEPISRNHGSYRRTAEAEPISRNHGSYRRTAEAEPISRNHGSYRRSAEAEPAISHSNQKTGNCHPGLLGSHC